MPYQLSATQKHRLRHVVYARDKGICQLCALPVMFEEMTLDRIQPGAPYNQANTWCCCEACNRVKGDQVLKRFAFRNNPPGRRGQRLARPVPESRGWSIGDLLTPAQLEALRGAS